MALVAALWSCAGVNVAAQPGYQVVLVGPSGSAGSTRTQVDPTGTYVTGSAVDGWENRAFLWTAGTSVYLAKGAGTVSSFEGAFAVNASGQVVGSATAPDGARTAYRWSVSEQTPLPALYQNSFQGQLETAVFSINAAGHAVGRSDVGPFTPRAVLWPAGTSSATQMAEDWHAVANAINDAGEVVGGTRVYPCPGRGDFQCWRATRWAGGQMTWLEPPAGFTNSSAQDINEAGLIVGRAFNGNTEYAAILWVNGQPVVLPPVSATRVMSADGVNASGQVVGRYLGDTNYRGFLWQAGVTYDLTGLLDSSGAGLVVRAANSISDDGKIAAEVCTTTALPRCDAALLVPAAPAPPVPTFTRYMAEGATSPFFDTRIALLNPGTTNASATVQYLPAGGAPILQPVTVPARTRLTINPKFVPDLAAAEFSTVVQSSQELVVDRTMSWDATGYGSHSETAVRAPATTWYLAEGATIGDFNLFYLLQNPAATPTTVLVRYLRTAGAPLTKTYVLPANSRTNIWVNEEQFSGLGKALASAEFSAVIESQDDTPIIVERAMYRSNQGRMFNAGHESTGVSTPSTDWFLAEGATGSYFDMFVLMANPTSTDAEVTITYLTIDGTTYSRSLVAPANARSGIWVDQEEFPGVPGKPLADEALSTTVTSTNGVPLVVERAMWWPGDSSTWHEAHNSAGATATGTKWAVAEGEVGGARGHETYLLIANTSAFAGSATVTLLFEDGTSVSRDYALPASSRTNVSVASAFGSDVAGRRFGAIVESTGATPAQIVVERAMYSGSFAAGTNALATKLQ